MIISDIKKTELADSVEISALIQPDTARKGPFRTWFRFPAVCGDLPLLGDAFVAGFIIPCMHAGENLQVDGPVSQRLLDAIPRMQDIIIGWNANFNRTSVIPAEVRQAKFSAAPRNTATFFSGGVDSWYTLLKHQPAISDLVLIHGFDIKGSEGELWEKTRESSAHVADELGKNLIAVETNLKKSADPRWASWGKPFGGRFWRYFYQGSALAAVALCLQHRIERIFVPSSYPYQRLIPFGSHPDLDPLWSTEDLEIVHDGCEAGRYEKIQQRVSHSATALNNLRVCLENKPGQYNCCRCEKCLRTMIMLEMCGSLGSASTFHLPLKMGRVRRLHVFKYRRPLYQDIQQSCEEIGHKELARALDCALGRRLSLDHIFSLVRYTMIAAAMKIPSRKWKARVADRYGYIIT